MATHSKPQKNKPKLHVRNRHQGRYDLAALAKAYPALKPFVKPNVHGDESVDFFDPQAVRMLNAALLKSDYQIDGWDIPKDYLCPPIPGRADYIHHISDRLGANNFGKIPKGEQVRCLDIGVGASCIYPLIGHREYGWSFVGSDIDQEALSSAKLILEANPSLKEKIELRHQNNPSDIFYGLINNDEFFDLSICNPPFHSSEKEVSEASQRKQSNLKKDSNAKAHLNFGGKSTELWCEGGEAKFVKEIIRESKRFAKNVFWFSTLISKENHLKEANKALKAARALEVQTIPMGQGNKSSRILAWTFFSPEMKADWQKRYTR